MRTLNNTYPSLTRVSLISASLLMAMTAGAAPPAATPPQDHKFLTRLYTDLLNRAPSRQELTLYTLMLQSGAPGTQIAGAITSSNEYQSDQIQAYFGSFLNRPATPAEVSFYVINAFQQGATDDDVKSAILGS